MDRAAQDNTTLDSFTANPVNLPLYLGTHNEIPDILIHEIPVAWMMIGMAFNGFLIYYLFASKKYRSPVFMLVLFLSFSDFAVCLSMACLAGFVWPVYLLPMHTWIVCKITYYLFSVSTSISSYYLVLFAALRFYQLCFPLKARARVTSSFVRNWCLVIICVWIIGWSPFLFFFTLIDAIHDGKQSIVCTYIGDFTTFAGVTFLVVNTCIPGISIPVLHLMKYIGVALTRRSGEAHQDRKNNTDIRALMIVIVMFFICWFPMNIYGVAFEYPPNHYHYQNKVLLLLAYFNGTNNALNPVIYCLASSTVRRDIDRLLCKKNIANQLPRVKIS